METTLNPPCLWNVTEYVQVNEIWLLLQNSNCNKIVIAYVNVRAMSHLNQHKNYTELVAKSLSGHIYFSDDVSNCSSGIKMPLTFNTSVSKITIRYKLINISYWDMQEAYWNCFHHKLKFIINHKLTYWGCGTRWYSYFWIKPRILFSFYLCLRLTSPNYAFMRRRLCSKRKVK